MLNNRVNVVGWLVFAITMVVYFFSVERTGKPLDYGEFVLGAYKLQVVHPPRPLFCSLVGYLPGSQPWSSTPSDIAFSVNLMSGLCSALAAMFMCWTTIMFSKLALYGRSNDDEASMTGRYLPLVLSPDCVLPLQHRYGFLLWKAKYTQCQPCFCLTLWSAVKWYYLPDTRYKMTVGSFCHVCCSAYVGVHLLSLLAFPTICVLYYYKRYERHI